MRVLQNDTETVLYYKKGIINKISSLGTGEIQETVESNIIGVTDNSSTFYSCLETIKNYKALLERDLTILDNMGITLSNFDSNSATVLGN